MRKYCPGKSNGCGALARGVAAVMILAGLLLLLISIPRWVWPAMAGLALIAGGLILWRLG